MTLNYTVLLIEIDEILPLIHIIKWCFGIKGCREMSKNKNHPSVLKYPILTSNDIEISIKNSNI